MTPLIISGKPFQGRLENMLNKILCIVLGHKWQFVPIGLMNLVSCGRCLKSKWVLLPPVVDSGMPVDPVAVNASKCCKG